MDTTGGATYADCVLGVEGNYLVASTGWAPAASCIIDMDDGSLVRMWTDASPQIHSATYGKSTWPAVYGDTYWVIHTIWNGYVAWEVDLGGAHPGVEPASIGRIKAVYR
jgi:hypothetical protein